MQGKHVIYAFHVPGTLAANVAVSFNVPAGMTLVEICCCSTSSDSGGVEVGSDTDADAYLVKTTVGASNNPQVITRVGMVGAQYPHLDAGDTVAIALDYDYPSGAVADWACVLTFVED
jgi:hypothetical protein